MKDDIYIDELVRNYPKLAHLGAAIGESIRLLHQCYLDQKKIMTCGNGGSASDASHIVGELMKGFALSRAMTPKQKELYGERIPDDIQDMSLHLQQGIPAVSLVADQSLITAIANDQDPDYIFAQQVFSMGQPGDVLIAISTSGNSANVLNAAKIAQAKGVKVIALTGKSGGRLKDSATININAPSSNVWRIQEYHLPIYHCLCLSLEDICFGNRANKERTIARK